MKISSVLLLGALLLIATAAQAQPVPRPATEKSPASTEARSGEKTPASRVEKNNNITFYPAGGTIGGVGIGFQRGLLDTITVGARFVYISPLFFPTHAISAELMLFFWPRHPNNGLYVGPVASVHKAFLQDDDEYGVLSYAGGAIGGWRWIWPSGFNVAVGAGVLVTVDASYCPERLHDLGLATCKHDTEGFSPTGRFDLGYAF
jgi:hypothetical protein